MEKINSQHLIEEDVERSTWRFKSEEDYFLGYFEQKEGLYEAGILAEEDTAYYDKDPRFFSGPIFEVEPEEPEEAFRTLLENTNNDSHDKTYSLRPNTA